MNDNAVTRARSIQWAVLLTLLAIGGLVGLWLWRTHSGLGIAAGLLMAAAALAAVLVSRVRAARRFAAALDAYADQELARAERRKA